MRLEQLALITKKYGKRFADELDDKNADRDKFLTLAAKYGATTALSIINRKIQIGWSCQMVKESLGEPDEVTSSDYGSMYAELWTYEIRRIYLYFSNGKVANITHIPRTSL